MIIKLPCSSRFVIRGLIWARRTEDEQDCNKKPLLHLCNLWKVTSKWWQNIGTGVLHQNEGKRLKGTNWQNSRSNDPLLLLLIQGGMTGSHQFIAEIALPKTVAVVVPTAAPNLLIGSKSGLSVGESLRARTHIRFADFTPTPLLRYTPYGHMQVNIRTNLSAQTSMFVKEVSKLWEFGDI